VDWKNAIEAIFPVPLNLKFDLIYSTDAAKKDLVIAQAASSFE